MVLVQQIDDSTYCLVSAMMGNHISMRTFPDPESAVAWAMDEGYDVYTGDCE